MPVRPNKPAARIVAVALETLLLTATAGSAQTVPPAITNAQPLAGFWRFIATGEVLQFQACGQRMCARVVALAPGERQTTDVRNPNPDQRGRPICGITVIANLHMDAHGDWRGGDAYSPEDGNHYAVRIMIGADGDLIMRASMQNVGFLGRTYHLARTLAPQRCP